MFVCFFSLVKSNYAKKRRKPRACRKQIETPTKSLAGHNACIRYYFMIIGPHNWLHSPLAGSATPSSQIV